MDTKSYKNEYHINTFQEFTSIFIYLTINFNMSFNRLSNVRRATSYNLTQRVFQYFQQELVNT